MANTGNSIKWEAVREIAAGSITDTYQVFGGIFTRDSFRIWVTNNTNGDIYISTDGISGRMKLPALTGRAYDNKTNDMFLRTGTQLYIRYELTPVTPAGWAAVEVEYV